MQDFPQVTHSSFQRPWTTQSFETNHAKAAISFPFFNDLAFQASVKPRLASDTCVWEEAFPRGDV